MKEHPTQLTKAIFITISLLLGCSSSGTLGCGSSGGGEPAVDSKLIGIYQIDRYQGSQGGCDQLMDLDGAPRVVLYSAPSPTNSARALLAGLFCGSVDNCRQRVASSPPAVNYSFFEGSDSEGWQGWGIASQGMAGERCQAEVQTHTLTTPGPQAIRIDTSQVETVFEGTIEDGVATCANRDAIESIDDDSPCKAAFLLEATFETDL